MSVAATPLAELERRSGQNVWACYQCGKCTAECPYALNPQEVMRLLQLGDVAGARELTTTWECASCLSCEVACPKKVSPGRIHKALRSLDIATLPAASDGPLSWGTSERATTTVGPTPTKRLRDRVLASSTKLFHLGSALAPVSNWLPRLPGGKIVAHHVLGVHRERDLPPFVRPDFPTWFRGHTPLSDGHRGRVLLFHDTFMDSCFPRVGVAATELLELAGFRVELTDTVCCGRPLISKGFPEKASACASTNVARLAPAARAGDFIVGCEPSCLLSFRDEYPHLVPAHLEEDARAVARQALLLDEFLMMLAGRGELALRFRESDGARPVLFHGHCHQKALASPARSLELLELAGFRPELANAACCGMAGLYGYETSHYERSRAAGERALFPAVRSRPEAELCVVGVSCRSQIEHFTHRPARHLAELVREAVVAS